MQGLYTTALKDKCFLNRSAKYAGQWRSCVENFFLNLNYYRWQFIRWSSSGPELRVHGDIVTIESISSWTSVCFLSSRNHYLIECTVIKLQKNYLDDCARQAVTKATKLRNNHPSLLKTPCKLEVTSVLVFFSNWSSCSTKRLWQIPKKSYPTPRVFWLCLKIVLRTHAHAFYSVDEFIAYLNLTGTKIDALTQKSFNVSSISIRECPVQPHLHTQGAHKVPHLTS